MASSSAPISTENAHPAPAGSHTASGASAAILIVAAGVFVIWALALLAPTLAATIGQHLGARAGVSTMPPVATLSAAELDLVLGYAKAMQPDDQLVQVRNGVFAKRSNVEGLPFGGRTVYYDVVPHQSFGPLRSGKLEEKDVDMLARVNIGDALVLVYTPKR